MNPTPKVNPEPPPDPAVLAEDIGANLAGLFLKSVERFGEIQKQTIDFAVQQNAEVLEIFKKVTAKMPGAPKLPVFDLATGTVSRYAEAQKSAINFVVEQNKVWTDTLKDRTRVAKEITESNVKTAKQVLERSFAVNKKALDNTATQAKVVLDTAKGQFGFNGKEADVVTDSFKKGIDALVDAQKEMMDLVTQ